MGGRGRETWEYGEIGHKELGQQLGEAAMAGGEKVRIAKRCKGHSLGKLCRQRRTCNRGK